MHIQKKLTKYIALGMCAFMLSFSVFTANPMTVHAEEFESVGSLEKTLDMTLVKLGIVCDENGLTSIANTLYDTAIGNVQEFDEYCTTNELNPIDASSYEAWKEEREYQNRLLDMVMETKYRKATEDGSEVTLDFTKDDMNDAIHGGDGVRRGEEYTIDEDTVTQMHTAFQNWWSANSNYYIYRVPSYTEIPVTYFYNKTEYDGFCTFMENAEDGLYDCVISSAYANKGYIKYVGLGHLFYDTWNMPKNYAPFGIGYPNNVNISDYCNWTPTNHIGTLCSIDSGENYTSALLSEGYTVDESTLQSGFMYYFIGNSSKLGRYYEFTCSNVARNIKVFTNINTLKTYDAGQQTVYFSPSYDSSVTNTVTYSGDYYCDNSSSYAYESVQSDVNNITGDVTDSIVDSTVDQSITNITNNYYTGSSDGDGTTDGDSDSSLDGFFGGLKDLVNFLLNLIGEIVSVITGLGNGIINLIKPLTSLFSGFTGLLGEVFTFVPQEIMDCLSAGFSAIVLIAVYNKFMGGKN